VAEAVDSVTEKVKSGAPVTFSARETTFSKVEKVKSGPEKTNSSPLATFSRHELVNSVTEAGFGGTAKINSEREASFCPLASLPAAWRR